MGDQDDNRACGCAQVRARTGEDREFAAMLAWGARVGQSLFPANGAAVERWVRDHRQRLATTTMRKRIGILRLRHRAACLPWPDVTIGSLLAATSTVGDRGWESFDADILERLLCSISGDDWRDVRDRAMFHLAWSASLRPEELVSLAPADVAIDDDGLMVRLRQSCWTGDPRVDRTPESMCPVSATERWMATRRDFGVMFYEEQQSLEAFDEAALSEMVRRRLLGAGIDPRGFAASSMRGAPVRISVDDRGDAQLWERPMNLMGERC